MSDIEFHGFRYLRLEFEGKSTVAENDYGICFQEMRLGGSQAAAEAP